MTRPVSHIVCDLDNTLYNWVGYFVPSFYSMVDQLVIILGCDREVLLDDLRDVHVQYHDAEHAFAALDTATVKRRFKGWSREATAEALDPAFHAYNRTRLATLSTYTGVHETLGQLRDAGVVLIAHSEAKFHAINDRLNRLNLFDYFTRIYCRERSTSTHPNPLGPKVLRSNGNADKIVELEHHQRKPSPEVLLEICVKEGASVRTTAFVGDSMAKDIAMAKDAGVFAVWAQYGTEVSEDMYRRLVRVSHWTVDEVKSEATMRERASGLKPDAILSKSIAELLTVVRPIGEAERIHA